MKIAGKTVDYKGEEVNVYQCEHCETRSTFKEQIESHVCKQFADSLSTDPELQCPICKDVGKNWIDGGWYVCSCGHSIVEAE